MASTITPVARTFPELFFEQVRRGSEGLALRHKVYGIWRRVSWTEYGDEVRRVAAGLLAFGLRPQERVAILGDNRPEWLYCHLGAMAAGGATCGIYATSAPEQIKYLLSHSESRILFLESEEQLEKALQVVAETPVERVVVWDPKGLWGFTDGRVTFFDDFLKQGTIFLETHPGRLEERLAVAQAEDTAMIIYTSGTTGPPKGAMLSHRNILWAVEAVLQTLPWKPDEEVISYLPFAHIFENFTSVFNAVRLGFVVNFVESPDTLSQNLREVSPTYFAGPPRIWEKLASTVELRMADSTLLKRTLYCLAVEVGRRRARAQQRGRVSPLLRLAYGLAYLSVLYPLKRRLGFERIRFGVSAAAPAAPELFEFFHGLGVPLLEVYGQTESTGVISANRPARPRVGTVGEPIPGIEVTLADDGEILTRGPHVFQGYFKDEEATSTVLADDGWLRTGDIGELDADGFLRITDRKKDILVTAGGKNVPPQNIENDLKTSKYVSQALVVGDKRPYVAALITLDPEEIGRWAAGEGIDGDVAALARDEGVRALIQTVVDDANSERSRFEQVKRFAILPRDFTMAEGEITPTLKLRRRAVIEHFSSEIDALYAEPHTGSDQDAGG